MIRLTLREVADIVGGELVDATGEELLDGPAFRDHRGPEPGGLFTAFVGERVDGHDFAAEAVAAGAVGALATRPTGVPSVLVEDVRTALQELAAEVLRRLRAAGGPTVVAVTGSQGKTSVKDLLGQVLTAVAPTVATEGSLNNEIGLPLTVLRADPGTRYLVLEMGARGIGHLTELCRIAPPDVSVVLNVGKAHIGGFGSQENIALAKGELVEALSDTGRAVLNADDPRVIAMVSRTRARAVRFGRAAGSEVRLGEVRLDSLGRPEFDVHIGEPPGGDELRLHLQLLGEHQAGNAAAVLATVVALGLDPAAAAVTLESITTLSRWRMELHERSDGLVVVNDAYNANPASMRAALETVAAMRARSGRRTVAVLGEMLELGASADDEHALVGRLSAELGLDDVVVVGPGAAGIARGRSEAGRGETTRHVEGVDEAVRWLGENVAGADLVLVKASRGAGLERVAAQLLEEVDDR